MATLKLRHLILYFVLFTLLYISDIPGGALLSIASWLQLSILLWKIEFTSKKQILVFMYFLTLIPLLLIDGSLVDFVKIYSLKNFQLKWFLFFVLYMFFSLLTFYLATLNFSSLKKENNLNFVFFKPQLEIESSRIELLGLGIIFLLLPLFPIITKTDFKISLCIILTHLYLKRQNLKNLNL